MILSIMATMFLILVTSSKFYMSTSVLILILNVTLISCLLKFYLLNNWSSILLFLALIGGLMILFSFFMSTLPSSKDENLKFPIWRFFMISLIFLIMNYNISETEKSVSLIYHFNSIVILTLMITLLIVLMSASKMIMSPIKPFKSIY